MPTPEGKSASMLTYLTFMEIVQKEIAIEKRGGTTYAYTLHENDYVVNIIFTVSGNQSIRCHFPFFQMEMSCSIGFNLLIASALNLDWNKIVTLHSAAGEYLGDEDKKKVAYATTVACSDLKRHF